MEGFKFFELPLRMRSLWLKKLHCFSSISGYLWCLVSETLHLGPVLPRRQWQPTPVLLPGKSHGWRSLVGCSPWPIRVRQWGSHSWQRGCPFTRCPLTSSSKRIFSASVESLENASKYICLYGTHSPPTRAGLSSHQTFCRVGPWTTLQVSPRASPCPLLAWYFSTSQSFAHDPESGKWTIFKYK